jgi:hypothetical protein
VWDGGSGWRRKRERERSQGARDVCLKCRHKIITFFSLLALILSLFLFVIVPNAVPCFNAIPCFGLYIQPAGEGRGEEVVIVLVVVVVIPIVIVIVLVAIAVVHVSE